MALNPTLIRRIVYTPQSTWVFAVMLTCDNLLAIQFKRRLRNLRLSGQRRGIKLGFVPGVVCLYPGTTEKWFNLALVWASKGKYVWEFLYKKMPYKVIPAPAGPFGCKDTLIATSSVNPSAVGQSVTFTATVTNTSGSAPPEGKVTWYDGATLLGPGTALSCSGNVCTSTYTTTALAAGTHTITGTFTDLTTGNEGFLTASGSVTQVVGTTVACCPGAVPNTLHLTLVGVVVFATSYTLTYNAAGGYWTTGTFSLAGGTNEFRFACQGSTTPGGWRLHTFCGGSEGLPVLIGTSGSCSPFSIGFGGKNLAYGPSCLSGDTATSFTVTS